MIALDSSVVVACFGAWHENHAAALNVLEQGPLLPLHATLEAYSVLTRLPDPFRAAPATVAEFLRRTFPGPRLALDHKEHEALPTRLATLGVAGGAVYDALIAFTARAAGAELVTLDRRALGTYQRCGAPTRLLFTDDPPARSRS
ncbi:MAG: VapC toxin family PIN domain ribonuclease [Pseudonocardiales bacterium]|nr:MAG: VapC toxin family PIN domain ribonuclease [Pseudonocardiales bacterium]